MASQPTTPLSESANLPPDDEYQPGNAETSRTSGVQTTPQGRARHRRDGGIIARVNLQAKHTLLKGRCSIENVVAERGVEYAHVLPRSYGGYEVEMASLEWAWGFRYMTLNLDTRKNVFPLGASLHRMFDDGRYFLVPEEHVLTAIFDHASSNKGKMEPAAGETMGLPPRYIFKPLAACDRPYHYKLVPWPGQLMERITITYDLLPEATPIVTYGSPVNYAYPYTELPRITTHVHPAFVITQAVTRYNREILSFRTTTLASQFIQQLGIHRPSVEKMAAIYKLWMGFTRPATHSGERNVAQSIFEDPMPDPDEPRRTRSQTASLHTDERRAPVPQMAGRKRDWAELSGQN